MSVDGGPVFVLGAGGHAKVVISTLRAAGFAVEGAYDDRQELWGRTVLGVSILGPIEEHGAAAERGGRFMAAIGSNALRRLVVARTRLTRWVNAVHPTAFVDRSVRLGEGSIVFAGAIIQAESVIGAHSIVNTAATIDHDCVLGDFVHVAPGVHLGGEVIVGDGTLLGLGSSIVPRVQIGDDSVIGAGAVVVKNVASRATVVGVPAATLRVETRRQP